ncbi:ABC transporter ATP-binding protein/permease [Roseiflexus sp.]|uniref:ABC transporter ATP-binding protein/permease n=1 Tax=Roseiflexus sp. TaxID=2562120 RepID=UPI00398B6148
MMQALGFDRRLISRWTRHWVTISAIAGLLLVLSNIALFLAIGWTLDALLRGAAVLTPERIMLALALVVLKGVLGWLERFAAVQAAQDAKIAVRETLYEHALRLGPGGLDKERTGDLVNTAVDGMDWLEQYFSIYWAQFIVGMLTPVLVIGAIALLDWVTAVFLLVTLPLPPLLLGMTSKRFKAVSDRFFAATNYLNAQFLDSLQGMTTLKLFNQGATRGEQFRQENETLRQETMRLLAVNQLMLFLVDGGFALATTTALTLLGVWRFSSGDISAGMAVAFVLLSLELARPLDLIGKFFFAGAIGRSVAKKISAFLDEPPPVRENSNQRAEVATAHAGAAVGPQAPSLRFEHISFRYPGRDFHALQNVSITVQPGERVALVGPSGAGKSTLFQLLLRFFDPEHGQIYINDRPITQFALQNLRASISFVSQDPYLFYGTLRENLLVARPDATEAEIKQALRAAHLDEMVAQLPQGLETLIGERGLTLSGGQAQRVALARAFLKDAPIVLLDEPTSQLDSQTEEVVQESIERLMSSKTVLMIAHRLSTAMRADRIYVLQDGQVVESGTPDELLRSNGLFARQSGVSIRRQA